MAEELNIVRRYRSDGVVRQARIESEHRPRTHRKLLVGLVVLSLCIVGGTAALVQYMSGTITTQVAITSPIQLSDSGDDWTFGTQQTSGGSTYDLTTTATNNANKAIDGVLDLMANYSTDDGLTWGHYDFGIDGNGITITGEYSTDGGTNWVALDSSYNSDWHQLFPANPGLPATALVNFPIGNTLLKFHVAFATDLAPQQYQFSLVIRSTSWTGP